MAQTAFLVRDPTRQTINAIETEKYDPSLPLAFAVARLFGKPIEEILLFENHQSGSS